MSFLRSLGAGFSIAILSCLLILGSFSQSFMEGLSDPRLNSTPTLDATSIFDTTLLPNTSSTQAVTPSAAITKTVASVPETQTPAPLKNIKECTPPQDWVTHVVQAGETLEQISGETGISLADLISANCLDSTTVLQSGDEIFIPSEVLTAEP